MSNDPMLAMLERLRQLRSMAGIAEDGVTLVFPSEAHRLEFSLMLRDCCRYSERHGVPIPLP